MKPKSEFTAKTVLKTTGISYLSIESKLAAAIACFKSAHDSVIVVDSEQKLLGIVSPYQVLIRRRFPPETKLQKCLFHPPKIYLDTPLTEVLKLMLQTKIYYLPVIDQSETVLGIVTARRIIQIFAPLTKCGQAIAILTKEKPFLNTINISSSLTEALRFFEQTKFSKLVVVDKEGDLVGLLSYFDLLYFLSQPKERMDSFKHGAKPSSKRHYLVNDFLKTVVIQVNSKTTICQIIKLILEKEVGSVLVMKDRQKPLQIITTGDLLRYLSQ